jgi:DNA-binding NarL/FixJ family response regulator
MNTKPYCVLVVDDHAIVRRGVVQLLAGQPGIEACSEASTGQEALDQVKKVKPNLVVLDLSMPDMNGLEATQAIHEAAPETEVLILTMHFSDEIARQVMRSGARGYVLKTDSNAELLDAIQNLREGRSYYTGRLADSMAQSFAQGNPAESSSNGGALPGTPLSARELQIVQLLASGKANKEVAAQLGVSTRTIESHRNHIMRKMSFTSFSQIVRFAVRSGLIEP